MSRTPRMYRIHRKYKVEGTPDYRQGRISRNAIKRVEFKASTEFSFQI
mgnify:CR=1